MKKQTLLQMWDHLRQGHGITLRTIAALPADKLDSHPISNMRTPKELIVHIYDVVFKKMAEGVARGELVIDMDPNRGEEKKIASSLKTRDDILKFARDTWNATDKIVNGITDAQLDAIVKTPFGMDFPGFAIFGITNDEFLHHRGQLYAFSRALGVEPPMMWDFQNNEAAFQPRVAAQA